MRYRGSSIGVNLFCFFWRAIGEPRVVFHGGGVSHERLRAGTGLAHYAYRAAWSKARPAEKDTCISHARRWASYVFSTTFPP
jgi:hypothetical protein